VLSARLRDGLERQAFRFALSLSFYSIGVGKGDADYWADFSAHFDSGKGAPDGTKKSDRGRTQ
jgi:hypothetical protein